MNILISSDINYLDKYITMLYSLKQNTKEIINAYFLNYRVENNDISQFKTILKKYKINVEIIDVKGIEFGNYPIAHHLSIETYFRILAQFILPTEIDRILWLDADIIVMKDISAFYNQVFQGKVYIVCEEKVNNTEYGMNLKKSIGLPDDYKYFNAGVMLMNLELLRHISNVESIMRECEKLRNKVEWFDQDMLNILYQNQLKYDDPLKYNYQLGHDKDISKAQLNNICILHYNTRHKPWNYEDINRASLYYWKAYSRRGKREKKEARRIYKNKTTESLSKLFMYFRGWISLLNT